MGWINWMSMGLTTESFKAIQVACIRKLLVILNTMIKNNTRWKTKTTKS